MRGLVSCDIDDQSASCSVQHVGENMENLIYKLMRYEKWTQITNRYLYIKFNRSSWPNKVTTEVNNFPSMGFELTLLD